MNSQSSVSYYLTACFPLPIDTLSVLWYHITTMLKQVDLSPMIKIPGLSSGKGNWLSTAQQMYTKFQKGLIKKISMKTFSKIMVTEFYNASMSFFNEQVYN